MKMTVADDDDDDQGNDDAYDISGAPQKAREKYPVEKTTSNLLVFWLGD